MQSKSDNPVSVQASPWILRDPNVPDMGFATEAEALAAAASAIEEYLDIDGWSFEVQDVHVLRDGVMTHRATEVKQDTPEDELEAMEDDPEYQPPFDYYCNYEMLPVQSRVLPGDDAQGSQGYPALGLGGDEGEKAYCKMHHPPSIAARAAAKTKCQHVESYGPCDTGVPAGVKYCRFHAEVTVPRDKWTALLADKARLDRLAQLTEGVQKVYIEPLGWIQLDRVSLDAAFDGEQK